MLKIASTLTALLAAAALAPGAFAADGDLLQGKPIYTLGEPKTWSVGTEGEEGYVSYTFVTSDLAKLVATPTNTDNVYLYPENGTLNTEANQAIGIQGFYIDMEATQTLGTITTTWEGAAADSYKVYLTDTEPTLAILATEATYEQTGLGQYQTHTDVLNDGKGYSGRYLVFQPTKPTEYAWGVKIRSISATGVVDAELTTFTVAPTIVQLNVATAIAMTFKDQLGLDIAASDVAITVSDNATYADGKLTVSSGTEATLTATMGAKSLTATVYVAVAPTAPEASAIKTPIYTNGDNSKNATAGWVPDYNGGAVNNGEIAFDGGLVAWSFANARCIFFYNSETTGAWNGNITPADNGYATLELSVFGTKACTGSIEFEGTGGTIPATNNFTLEAGKWNQVSIDIKNESRLNNMSIRFSEENMCDILLANIYFTAASVEGDETAPVLGEITATPSYTGVTLKLSATENENSQVSYTIKSGDATWTTTAASNTEVEYTIGGLQPGTAYTFTVTASDGANTSAAKSVETTTLVMLAATAPTLAADKMIAVYCSSAEGAVMPTFDSWGSSSVMSSITTESGKAVPYFTNYSGQWGGLVDLTVDLTNTDYNTVHIDIFGDAVEGQIAIAPVWQDASGANVNDTPNKVLTVEASKWNGYSVALSEFGYQDSHSGVKVYQFSMSQSTLASFAIDNIYFYYEETNGIDDLAADRGEAVVNVYTLQGQCVRRGVAAADAAADLAPGLYVIGNRKVLVR